MVAFPSVARQGWCVYMLRCRDGSLYTGITNDVGRRLAAHAAGRGAAYTRSRRPVRLVYREPARGRGAALRREAALKRLAKDEKWVLVRSVSPPSPGPKVGRLASSAPSRRRLPAKGPPPRRR
jgi:putative endonuclease